MDEIDQIASRYEARKTDAIAKRYQYISPAIYMSAQERERALIRWIRHTNWQGLQDKRVLEVGCGSGGNLLNLLKLGFRPENLVGNELLDDRYNLARECLPQKIDLHLGDASKLDLPSNSFDVVLQSTVFSSILDNALQVTVAKNMWRMVKPGGGVLWYDFIYNNPNNSDVRGVNTNRIQQLFGPTNCKIWRITLAPPLSRMVCRIHPCLYTIANTIPLLRTHVLAWISKRE